MPACLDALELSELAATIPGVSPVGVAPILAQTGDPERYDCARTWVNHAGLCPRDNERASNPLRDGQARAAIAAALLRQLFIVITRRVAWDPDIASGRAHELSPTVAPMAA